MLFLYYWSDTPIQHLQLNRLYRRMRAGAADREVAHLKGDRHLPPEHSLFTVDVWTRLFPPPLLLIGTYLW